MLPAPRRQRRLQGLLRLLLLLPLQLLLLLLLLFLLLLLLLLHLVRLPRQKAPACRHHSAWQAACSRTEQPVTGQTRSLCCHHQSGPSEGQRQQQQRPRHKCCWDPSCLLCCCWWSGSCAAAASWRQRHTPAEGQRAQLACWGFEVLPCWCLARPPAGGSAPAVLRLGLKLTHSLQLQPGRHLTLALRLLLS